MDILHDRCAGLDLNKKTVVACVRTVAAYGRVENQVRTFATMTADLLELADWHAVRQVAMESTGVWWSSPITCSRTRRTTASGSSRIKLREHGDRTRGIFRASQRGRVA
jgi:hypothetical protein